MEQYTVALFGEAEKGDYQIPYYCETLPQLVDFLGNPPPETSGLYFAVQALLFNRNILFFRVREEGFSLQDYLEGMHQLENLRNIPRISAIGMPGVGDTQIINAVIPICMNYHSILMTTESDLFDYLLQKV